MDFEIKIDERLSLKLRHEEDAKSIFLLTDKNREYLRPWLPWVDKTLTAEDTKKYIEEQIIKFKIKLVQILVFGMTGNGLAQWDIMQSMLQTKSGYWLLVG